VEWGLTASYGSATTVDNTLVTVHSVQLMGLQADTQYHYRVRSRDADGNERVGTDRVFETPGDGENLSLGLPPDVSGSYSGYTATTITDGVNDPYGGASSTWASDESPSLPHWVEIDMGVTRTVDRVAVCWAWNEFRDAWMTSQQYKIQAWNGSSYVDLATVTDPTAGAVTVRSFAPVYTDRIRIWQPANAGPPEYTSVMWLSELEVLQAGGADTIPPATIQDLR
jgi:hypothetical protein